MCESCEICYKTDRTCEPGIVKIHLVSFVISRSIFKGAAEWTLSFMDGLLNVVPRTKNNKLQCIRERGTCARNEDHECGKGYPPQPVPKSSIRSIARHALNVILVVHIKITSPPHFHTPRRWLQIRRLVSLPRTPKFPPEPQSFLVCSFRL